MLLNSANFHPLTKLRTQSHHVGAQGHALRSTQVTTLKTKIPCCVVNKKVLHNVQPQQSLPDIIMNLKLNGHNPGLRGFSIMQGTPGNFLFSPYTYICLG